MVFLSKESIRRKRLLILMGVGLVWNAIRLERRALICCTSFLFHKVQFLRIWPNEANDKTFRTADVTRQ